MVLRMSNQEDFGRPEKPLEKTREIDNEARISKKAEMKKKFNRNQKRRTLWDIHLSSLISLVLHIYSASILLLYQHNIDLPLFTCSHRSQQLQSKF